MKIKYFKYFLDILLQKNNTSSVISKCKKNETKENHKYPACISNKTILYASKVFKISIHLFIFLEFF